MMREEEQPPRVAIPPRVCTQAVIASSWFRLRGNHTLKSETATGDEYTTLAVTSEEVEGEGKEIATHRERQSLSLWSLSFMFVLGFFAFWGL